MSFGYQVLGFGAGGVAFNPIVATGGCVTTDGNYKIHVFKSPGTFCVSCAGSGVADYITQAGGAGGGRTGGSGAGGLRFSSCTYTAHPCSAPRAGTALTVSATGYPIAVGCGGSGTPVNPPVPVPSGNKPTKGADSTFATITSAGGGTGYMSQAGACGPYTNGGSGGGGVPGGASPKISCSGIGNSPPVSPVQGYSSTCNPGLTPDPEGPRHSIDGGGAGGNTANYAPDSPPRTGAAGLGFPTCIMKSCVGVPSPSPTVKYIGGGGGGGSSASPSTFTIAQHGGGNGGGATPGTPGAATTGSPGTANTGGGGGGGGAGGGRSTQPPQGGGGGGGSGLVIIRYKYQ